MKRALDENTPRVIRSNVCCGGCMALHASAFTEVPFDLWITRGEDLDYLLNLRLAGKDLWFDSAWHVRHLPPPTRHMPARFLQDVYRWMYEAAKLERANKRIDVQRTSPSSLDPYPGPWLMPNVTSRIAWTSLLRAIGCPERKEFFGYSSMGVKKLRPMQLRMPSVIGRLWPVGSRLLPNCGTIHSLRVESLRVVLRRLPHLRILRAGWN